MPNLGPISLNVFTVVVALSGLAVVAWSVQAYRAAESATEAGQEVGDKVQRSVGGVVGFISALTVGLIAGIYDAGMEFTDVLGAVSEVVATSPQSAMGAIVAALGTLGVSGAIQITPVTYAGFAIVLLGAGIAIANRDGAQS